MQVGIIGMPLSGKTTIYNALTGSQAETANYSSGQVAIHTAVVRVPDPRVDLLSSLFNPKKTTYAQIQFNDVSGISEGAGGKGFDPQVINAISKCDALLQVVRGFDDPILETGAQPADDLAALRFELIVSDLAIVERRIERIDAGYKKARGDEKALLDQERALLVRFQEALEAERLISDLELTEDEAHLIRGFQFLTAKPSMAICNLAEDQSIDIDLSWANHHRNVSALALQGALEMEIAQLGDEDKTLFLDEYGISEPGLHRMVRASYDLLGLMSFFTVGEDEVRAWTVRRDASAVEAAGAIHSDLARGFIRAEVISYDDMVACQTLANARKEGKLRLEGKTYTVQDGDVISIRFNV